MLANILLSFVFLGILIFSAKLVESAFVELGRTFRINEFFLGFVVLGLITSLPEISIAIFSSEHHPEISAGNLIGATTIILTLVIGLSAIKYKKIAFEKDFSTRESLGGIFIISLGLLALVDRNLAVYEGIGLILAYLGYVILINRKMWTTGRKVFFLTLDNSSMYKSIILVVVGIFLLLFSSNQIVNNLEAIVDGFGISGTFVGLVLLSLGTNLPELTILFTAKPGEEESLALGNFFGSACINVAILGTLAIISNGVLLTDITTLTIGLFFLFFALIMFVVFSLSERNLSRREGVLMVSIYVAMVISQIIVLI